MGTVYRNLELLAKEGAIQKLENAGKQKRFDGNPRSHYHVRCINCGRVADINIWKKIALEGSIVEDAAKEVTDFEITGHRLELLGLCPRCRTKNPRSRKGYRLPGRGGIDYSVEDR